MLNTPDRISVEALKGVSVLYEGDIYELAQLLIKVNAAKDKGTNRSTRRTINGLATAYSNLAGVEFETIIAVFERDELPLGATVELAQTE